MSSMIYIMYKADVVAIYSNKLRIFWHDCDFFVDSMYKKVTRSYLVLDSTVKWLSWPVVYCGGTM